MEKKFFNPTIFKSHGLGRLSKELGTLIEVKDTQTALDAIKEIKEQGEGASPIDPTVSDGDQLGHYYQLMEIVCQKKLVKNEDDKYYSYSGADIPFDSKGVWPMRDDPSKEGTTGNCYTEARAFHTAYRNLLRELHATFGGEPERIASAVTIMESLLVHGKRVMRVPLTPESEETCGPVWDYEWEEKQN
uniref:Iminophenyl-pyruvate dimer synthase domain-containing protein n=1 Tax=Amphimedon queenslandica TaxID=400682 RepID=A0A1X7V178_AMPQE